MSLLRLSLVVAALTVSVVLALTNPTIDEYLVFVQAELTKALDQWISLRPNGRERW